MQKGVVELEGMEQWYGQRIGQVNFPQRKVCETRVSGENGSHLLGLPVLDGA